jgi:hypothetical protein
MGGGRFESRPIHTDCPDWGHSKQILGFTSNIPRPLPSKKPFQFIGHPTNLTPSIYLWLYSPCGPQSLFQFPNIYTIGRTLWTGDQPFARPLPTHRTTQTQNKRTETSIPQAGFEPTTPVFEQAKTVHALERAATVIGTFRHYITVTAVKWGTECNVLFSCFRVETCEL